MIPVKFVSTKKKYKETNVMKIGMNNFCYAYAQKVMIPKSSRTQQSEKNNKDVAWVIYFVCKPMNFIKISKGKFMIEIAQTM